MKENNYSRIYDTAINLIESLDLYVKEYFDDKQLALWVVAVYSTFDQLKVITTRILGKTDSSVIVSHHKISVIINDYSVHSWVKCEEVIVYDNLEDDIENLLTSLDIAYIRTDMNRKPIPLLGDFRKNKL